MSLYLVVQPKSLYFESCPDRFPQSVNVVRLTHRWWYIRERESLDDQMVTINTRRQYKTCACACNDSVRNEHIEYYFVINIISVCRLQIPAVGNHYYIAAVETPRRVKSIHWWTSLDGNVTLRYHDPTILCVTRTCAYVDRYIIIYYISIPNTIIQGGSFKSEQRALFLFVCNLISLWKIFNFLSYLTIFYFM